MRFDKTWAEGIAMAVIAVAFFAALDTTTKWVTGAVPVFMALFVRYLIQAIGATLMVWSSSGTSLLRTRHPRFHLVRGLLLLLCSTLAFWSLSRMPVGEFTAIIMVTPLIVTLLAAKLLDEVVPPLQWLFVAGGFAGTLLIVRPVGDNFSWVLALPMALVVANTGFQLLTSRMSKTEHPMTLQFYTSWSGTLVLALPLYWLWTEIEEIKWWVGMVAMGLCSFLGHLFFIWSFQKTPASTLMPFMYVQIAFAMLGGWLIFQHEPDSWTLAGMALIATCGVGSALLGMRKLAPAIEPVEH